MGTIDIPLDKAELLAVLLEALLYGFSLLMSGGTIWTLVFRQSTHQVNRKMLIVTCLLLLGSTVHLVIDIFRAMEGLILYRDTNPGGPIGYFSDVSQWTFLYKSYVYVAQTLIGDGVVLHRCYAIWQSKLVMVVPALLWCTVAVTGILTGYTASKQTQCGVFGGSLREWIISFWTMTLATNLSTTFLLVYRIWHVDRKAAKLCPHRRSQLRPTLYILVDAGAIYSLTLVAVLTCFVIRTNGQYVVLDMITPIVSIMFYMVIIRVGLATRANHVANNTSMDNGVSTERRRKVQVHVTTLTQSMVDDSQRSLSSLTSPNSNENTLTVIGFDSVGQAV